MKKRNDIFIFLTIILILIIGFLLINNIQNKQGELKKISYKEIKEKTEKKGSFALIVSRSNCSHCIEYKPKAQQIAKKYKTTIYYIDYDNEKNKDEFLNEFNLDGSTPITIFIKKGKETSILKRLEGDVEIEKLEERLKELEFIK